MKKFVYKVVRRTDKPGLWLSAVIQGAYSLQYHIGGKTSAHRNTTGVLCFKTLEDATRFKITRSYPNQFAILKCECGGRQKEVNLTLYTYAHRLNYAINRSVAFLRKVAFTGLIVPAGTVCLNAVTPVEVVE